jgi:hypothetical protein
MSRKVQERMADDGVVALCADGGDWPHAFRAATPIPDGWMGLVERRDGSRRLVPAGEEPRSAVGDRLVLVRTSSIQVPLAVDETPAACGHGVLATCGMALRWQARDDDLAALRAALLGSGELSADALGRAVAHAGAEAALRKFIRQRPAGKLVHDDLREDLFVSLREELKKFLFSAGATLEGLSAPRFVSPMLAQEERIQRDADTNLRRIQAGEMVQQARLTATQRRLDGLSTIFEKLRTAAGSDQSQQWHDLLPALSPGERGQLLENLWRLTPDRQVAQAIVAAAGNECVWIDPAHPDSIVRRVTLAADFGGLRSTAFCHERGWLLVGAARGVWVLNAADGALLNRYEVPETESPRTGFNSAAVCGDRLVATHSQLGCWSWRLDQSAPPTALLRPAAGVPKTVRAATPVWWDRLPVGVRGGEDRPEVGPPRMEGHVLFAADDRVHAMLCDGSGARATGSVGSSITCLALLDDELYVGTADGVLVVRLDWSAKPPALVSDAWRIVHRARGAIETIVVRRWNDLIELVLPAGLDGVCGVYAEESIVSRLMPAYSPIRRVWACDDAIVALNENRDRLAVLHSSRPERIAQEIPLARMLGSSIQDACLVTKHSESAASGEGPDHVV